MNAVWVALVGMIVYLDTTAVGQIMICQPLIACPVLGLIAGRPDIGLFFGVTFQLIWMGSLPVGASKFPEGNVGAIIATALALRVAPTPEGTPAWIALALPALIGLLAAQLGAEVTPWVRRIIAYYTPRVVEAARQGRRLRFTSLFFGAVGIHALAGFILTFVAFVVGWRILTLYLGDLAAAGVSEALAERTDDIAASLWPGLLGAGVAVIVGRFVHRPLSAVFALTAAVAAIAGWIWL